MAKQQVRQMIFTTKLVDESTDMINDGIVIKRYQNPWLKSEVGLRRAGVTFKMTPEEQQEYVKCALDIHYFVEKYCKVKREDGSVGHITLRDYQKDIWHLVRLLKPYQLLFSCYIRDYLIMTRT